MELEKKIQEQTEFILASSSEEDLEESQTIKKEVLLSNNNNSILNSKDLDTINLILQIREKLVKKSKLGVIFAIPFIIEIEKTKNKLIKNNVEKIKKIYKLFINLTQNKILSQYNQMSIIGPDLFCFLSSEKDLILNKNNNVNN